MLKEITDNHDYIRRMWVWHARAPEPAPLAEVLEAVTGPDWRHFGWYTNETLTVGLSLQRHRAHGYELHVASCGVRPPDAAIRAVQAMGDWLAEMSPDVRVVVWVAEENVMARRLAARFMEYETTMRESRSGLMMRRYAITGAQWKERSHGKPCQKAAVR